MPLAAQMMRLAPDAGDPLYVETFLRCKVAEHSEGRHYDLVWQLDDARQGEMWAAWTDGRAPEAVLLLPDCPGHNGKSGQDEEACTLFARHPGPHSYDLDDPEIEALSQTPGYHRLSEEIDALIAAWRQSVQGDR
ncbi:hypothetical protein [Streptomyces sp. NPDC005953]|uniref:hypothetical protein n=1 Tax=Streptomyces sp. NPDC005953 TaxID=3156719 RepID=UPI0033DB067D